MPTYPGLAGHQYFVSFLAAFALVGLVATMLLELVVRGQTQPTRPARA